MNEHIQKIGIPTERQRLRYHGLRAMVDLPNKAGFRFFGTDHDGNRHACVVKVNAVGCHSVYREDNGEPYFMSLVGWQPVTSATGSAS